MAVVLGQELLEIEYNFFFNPTPYSITLYNLQLNGRIGAPVQIFAPVYRNIFTFTTNILTHDLMEALN